MGALMDKAVSKRKKPGKENGAAVKTAAARPLKKMGRR
jgi:hypothetical protein